MRNNIKIKDYVAFIALSAFFLTSCQKDQSGKVSIFPKVTSTDLKSQSGAAESEGATEVYSGIINGIPVSMDLVVSRNTDGVGVLPATKGAIIVNEGANGINHSSRVFGIHAYLDDDVEKDGHFIGGAVAGERVDYTGDNSTHSWDWDAAAKASGTDEDKDAYRPKWTPDTLTRFWSYFPADYLDTVGIEWPHDASGDDTPSDAQQQTVSFHYEVPKSATADPNKDAESQKDILFAYNEKTYSGTTTNSISINFYHMLAAVNFDISLMSDEVQFGQDPSITIKHVRHSGDCTVYGPSLAITGPGVGTSGVTWSNLSTDFKDYSQNFDKSTDFKSTSSKVFFMIPQTLSDALLSISFDFKDGGVPVTIDMPFNADTWLAGNRYTYRIKVGADGYTLLDGFLNAKDWNDGNTDVTF